MPRIFQLSDLDGNNGFIVEQPSFSGDLGWSVSFAGDINQDGIDDIVFGAPLAELHGDSYVVYGNDTGFNSPLLLSQFNTSGNGGSLFRGISDSDSAGFSVSSIGDVNNDTIDDVIIGAYRAEPTGFDNNDRRGESYVLFGRNNDFPTPFYLSDLDGNNGFTLEGIDTVDWSGYEVAGAGDINGDGIADIIIGAPSANIATGETYVIFGNNSGFNARFYLSDLDGDNGFVLYGINTNHWSGIRVSTAGDVNGDGIVDILIGADGAEPVGESAGDNRGQSYVFFGSESGFSASYQLSDLNGDNGFILQGEATGDSAGSSVDAIGDINDDGLDDLIIGAKGANSTGKTYIIFGKNNNSFPALFMLSDVDGNNGFVINGITSDDATGYSVSRAGDFNGDGISDVIIGAYQAEPESQPGSDHRGESYIIFGRRNPFPATLELSSLGRCEGLVIEGVNAGDESGFSVGGGGDINDDDISDVIIGAPEAEAVYVVFGDPRSHNQGINSTSPPTLINNQLMISEGEAVAFDSSDISATDPEECEPGLLFKFTNIQYGQFELISNPGMPITEVIQSYIMRSLVQFVHDGGELAPSFDVIVEDNTGPIAAESTVITYTPVNDQTPILVNNSLTIDEGQTKLIRASDIWATDADLPATDLQFNVSDVNNGRFEYTSNPMVTITSFLASEISANQVRFIHIGSSAPTYLVTVTDGLFSDGPEAASITFNDANNAPTLDVNTLTINEGQIINVSSANFVASDADGPVADSAIIFRISNLQYGYFNNQSSGMPVTSFLQMDITSNDIQFVHDGSEYAPCYDIVVDDTVTQSATYACNVTFSANDDDSPAITTNQLIIDENETVAITSSQLAATDVDSDNANLVFTISSIINGRFEYIALPGNPITMFNQSEVTPGNVIQFIHLGSESTPSYSVSVSDSSSTVGPEASNITFNSIPRLMNNTLTIIEGQTVILSSSNLSATDATNDDNSLTFTVSNVQHGQFEHVTNTGTAITTFTQLDVINSQIQFVHDGSEITPSFNVMASDGSLMTTVQSATIGFTNSNDMSMLITNQLTIEEGETLLLSSSNLNATDIDNDDADLIFEISAITHGQFEYVTNPDESITNFSQVNLTTNQVQFVHDGSIQAPSYNVVVFDGIDRTTPPSTASITFNTIDIPPALTNNTMTLFEGQTIILTSNELQATSIRISDNDVSYTLHSVQNGQFNRLTGETGITTFKQADIDNGEIIFVHDGGEVKPVFNVTLSDGQLVSGQQSVIIDFIPNNDPPSLVNNRLSLMQGEENVVLTVDQLSAIDTDNDDATLIFEVSDVSHGWFEKVILPGESITTFFQSEVVNGDIRFVHDRSDQAPSYKVRVSDGQLKNTRQRVAVTFGEPDKSAASRQQQPVFSWASLKSSFYQSYDRLKSTLEQWLFTDEVELVKQKVPESLQPRVSNWLNRYERLYRRGEYDDVSRWFNYGLEDCKADLFKTIEQGDLTASQLTFFEREVKGLEKTYLSSFGLLEEQLRPKGFMAVSSNRMTLWNRQGKITSQQHPALATQANEVMTAASGLPEMMCQTTGLLSS